MMNSNKGFSNLFIITSLILITSLFIQISSTLYITTRTLNFLNKPFINNNHQIDMISKAVPQSGFKNLNQNLIYSNNNSLFSLNLDTETRINEPLIIEDPTASNGTFLWRKFISEGKNLTACDNSEMSYCLYSNLELTSTTYTNTNQLIIKNDLILNSDDEILALGINGNFESGDNLILRSSLNNHDSSSYFVIAAFNDININKILLDSNIQDVHLLIYSSKGSVSAKNIYNFTSCSDTNDLNNNIKLSIIAESIYINSSEIDSDSYPLCNDLIKKEWFMNKKLIGYLRKEF